MTNPTGGDTPIWRPDGDAEEHAVGGRRRPDVIIFSSHGEANQLATSRDYAWTVP
jgi:hypothetical protein